MNPFQTGDEVRAGHYVGLISGTSMDGIDACLVYLNKDRIELRNCTALSYPEALRQRLASLALGQQPIDLDEYGQLDVAVGELFAQAADKVIAGVPHSDVIAIGSHGQTVRHRPEGEQPFTLQIGDPNVIAVRTGIDTVADFRRQDVALGGQGAPLAPLFHSWCLRDQQKPLGILNLGGIANLTVLTDGAPTAGFDTGPANALMDAWVRQCKGLEFDAAGHWATSGSVNSALLERLLSDPYFRLQAPKSTGIEYFNLHWLEQHADTKTVDPSDIQATLLELTARSVVDALMTHEGAPIKRLLVCGGGARNLALMARLDQLADDCLVTKSDELGMPGDWVESMTFAWLAARRVAGIPSEPSSVTGSSRPIILGNLTLA